MVMQYGEGLRGCWPLAIIERISPTWTDNMGALRCHTPGRDIEMLRRLQNQSMAIARDMKKQPSKSAQALGEPLLTDRSVTVP